MTENTVPFTEVEIKNYLDRAIETWRKRRNDSHSKAEHEMAIHYIDAFQSVRRSLFGELLPT